MTRTRAPPQPQENVQPASPIPDPSPCTNGQVNGPAQADHRSPEAWRSRGADPPQRGKPQPAPKRSGQRARTGRPSVTGSVGVRGPGPRVNTAASREADRRSANTRGRLVGRQGVEP